MYEESKQDRGMLIRASEIAGNLLKKPRLREEGTP